VPLGDVPALSWCRGEVSLGGKHIIIRMRNTITNTRPVARLHALSNHTGLGTGSPRLAGRKCLEERERETRERE